MARLRKELCPRRNELFRLVFSGEKGAFFAKRNPLAAIGSLPLCTLEILLHVVDSVVEGNPAASQEALKVELGKTRELSGLAERQTLLPKERDGKFRRQFGFSQFH